jgi:hypothetical protein
MACSAQGRLKKAKQVKSKVKSKFIIFFDIKGVVHKEFVLASQTAYYCDCLWQLCENVQRLRLDIWRKKSWLLHHDNAPFHTSFLNRNFFLPKTK